MIFWTVHIFTTFFSLTHVPSPVQSKIEYRVTYRLGFRFSTDFCHSGTHLQAAGFIRNRNGHAGQANMVWLANRSLTGRPIWKIQELVFSGPDFLMVFSMEYFWQWWIWVLKIFFFFCNLIISLLSKLFCRYIDHFFIVAHGLHPWQFGASLNRPQPPSIQLYKRRVLKKKNLQLRMASFFYPPLQRTDSGRGSFSNRSGLNIWRRIPESGSWIYSGPSSRVPTHRSGRAVQVNRREISTSKRCFQRTFDISMPVAVENRVARLRAPEKGLYDRLMVAFLLGMNCGQSVSRWAEGDLQLMWQSEQGTSLDGLYWVRNIWSAHSGQKKGLCLWVDYNWGQNC